jgi:hypothetical protein
MRFFRIVLSLYFVSLFTFFVISTFWVIPRLIHSRAEPDRILLPMDLACAVLTVVFGVAFWILVRSRASGRGWVIAASLLNLAISIGIPLFYVCVSGASDLWMLERIFLIPTAFGIAGLFAFRRERSVANVTQATSP